LLAVVLRVFVFEIYSIPSGSMEATLVPGDRIVVSKLSYGPALPRSPLEVPWFNAFFLINRRAITANDTFVWRYRRLPGLRNIHRGDVIVFRYPGDPHQTYIKRCVALPGDTVQVAAGILLVNGCPQPLPPTAKTEYSVWFQDQGAFQHLTDSLHLTCYGPWDEKDASYRYLNLAVGEAELLQHTAPVDSVSRYVRERDRPGEVPLAAEEETPGQDDPPDRFGPLVVPQRGMVMAVNAGMMRGYAAILARYEHFRPERAGSVYLWHGRPVTHYTFRQDYYFMMGDNRHNSTDSRWWGPVPEELITGKAKRILWSGNFKRFRFERVLKKIE